MNGTSKARRGLLVLAAGAAMTLAVAPGAGADPGDEVWTTRPMSDASYVAPDDRIPSMRAVSDASFVPQREAQEIPSTRWMSDATFAPRAEQVALNRYLSDASYYPTAAQLQATAADASATADSNDPSQLPLIAGLLAVMAGAAVLIGVVARHQPRPAI
jgi:hypothetical protein